MSVFRTFGATSRRSIRRYARACASAGAATCSRPGELGLGMGWGGRADGGGNSWRCHLQCECQHARHLGMPLRACRLCTGTNSMVRIDLAASVPVRLQDPLHFTSNCSRHTRTRSESHTPSTTPTTFPATHAPNPHLNAALPLATVTSSVPPLAAMTLKTAPTYSPLTQPSGAPQLQLTWAHIPMKSEAAPKPAPPVPNAVESPPTAAPHLSRPRHQPAPPPSPPPYPFLATQNYPPSVTTAAATRPSPRTQAPRFSRPYSRHGRPLSPS